MTPSRPLRPTLPISLACLLLGLLAFPAHSLGRAAEPGKVARPATAAHPRAAKASKPKRRCRVLRHGHRRLSHRCKKHRRKPPVGSPTRPPSSPPPSGPGAPGGGTGSGGGGSGGGGEPPSDYETVDLISNNGFEQIDQPTGCFAPFSPSDGQVSSNASSPIAGAYSLAVGVSPYGRVGCVHEYGFEAGPIGKSVRLEGELRIDAPTAGSAPLHVCAIVYLAGDPQPIESCHTYSPQDQGVLHVSLTRDTEGKRLQRVFFQLQAEGTPIEATLDEAHLYVERLKGSEGGQGGGGGGGGGGGVGRYAAMVSPTDGESFTTPLDLRLVGIGHDPNIFTNENEEHEPEPGKGTNAAKVEFLLDGTPIATVKGADAEYHVFKAFAHELDAAPGQHVVVARATYNDPSLVLESPPVTIAVEQPPAYARTVSLTEDVVLAPGQSYELSGSPGERVRLNGNGHSIVSPSGTSGHLVLDYVDVHGLGSEADTSKPGIDFRASSNGGVAIEHSVFDGSDPVDLHLSDSATATIAGNLFRSNMRMPIGQLPREEPPSPTVPVISIKGESSAHKVFAGNNVAAAPVLFEDTNDWAIGGPTDADTNVLIGPRASFEVLGSSEMSVEGNFLDHVYYGGWSQGQLLELHGTHPVTVEHNVLLDSSWPVRGIAGEFAYNLVLEAGHQWMVPDDGAYVHHNVFIGGDNDTGGITGYYDVSARIENNTFDGLLGDLALAAINWQAGEATLKSNAFVNFPASADTIVERTGGTIEAGYNGFFNPEVPNYSGGVTPVNDLNGGASTDPMFAGPLPTTTFEGDRVAVWKRQLRVSEFLAGYRGRYTPTPGSLYIDSGDPAGGPGNDVGAVGAGVVNPNDRFGSFGK
jgi:hypothetical protein